MRVQWAREDLEEDMRRRCAFFQTILAVSFEGLSRYPTGFSPLLLDAASADLALGPRHELPRHRGGAPVRRLAGLDAAQERWRLSHLLFAASCALLSLAAVIATWRAPRGDLAAHHSRSSRQP